MFRKTLVIGMIVLFIGVSIVSAANEFKSETTEPQNTNEGKPDLIVIGIYPHMHWPPYVTNIDCKIKNIGDAPAIGSIDLRLTVRRGIFGFIPVYDSIKSRTTDGFNPGETKIIDFGYVPKSIGFYRFKCEVNVFDRIDESNSNNNVFKKCYFILNPIDGIFGWYELWRT